MKEETIKRWAEMKEIEEGSGAVDDISVAAMDSLGIPYYTLRLGEECDEFYIRKARKNANGAMVADRRIHLNQISNRLLNILYHITEENERHRYLERLRTVGIIQECEEFPKRYSRDERRFMVAVDVMGQLREMPETLVNALRAGVDFSGGLCYQQRLKAFYAPFRVRAVLYFAAPAAERDEFWLDDEERKRAESLGIKCSLDTEARQMLVDRLDDRLQIADLDDDLFDEILVGAIETVDELRNFLAVDTDKSIYSDSSDS